MPAGRALLIFVAVLIAGCGSDEKAELPVVPAPAPYGVFAGTFPCFDCAGIDATLWLLPGREFLMRQRYRGETGAVVDESYGLGRWQWDAVGKRLRLEGAGPARVFSRPDAGTLLMDTHSDLEHRLERMTGDPAFDDTLRMEGFLSIVDGEHRFTECLSGLSAPVDEGGEFAGFRRQYRRLGGAGEPAFVELEGRFSWAAGGRPASLTLAKFVAIRPEGSC